MTATQLPVHDEGGSPASDAGKIKRILIYRCGTLGDTIVAIPAINSIRARYPDADLVLMTATGPGKLWAHDVIKGFGWFSDVVTYPERQIFRPEVMYKLIRHLRRLSPDVVIDLATDKNSGLRAIRDRVFFRLAGISKFVSAPSSKVTFWGRLKKDRVAYEKEVDRFLNVVAEYGDSGPARFDLPVGEREVRRIDTLLAKHGIARDAILVGLCPGSKQQAKRWPIDRYQEIGRRLIAAGAVIVTVGGVDEAAIGKRIGAYWPSSQWLNLAGELSVLESAELLRRCKLYVGNDTGPMHLAAAMNTPCVALFSAREPVGSWYPFGERHVVIRKEVECQNCFLETCRVEQLRCMREITIDEVWEACAKLLLGE